MDGRLCGAGDGALLATPAAADRGRLRDKKDTTGIFAIRASAHRHNDRGRLVHTVGS
jgi:hypothetical protein